MTVRTVATTPRTTLLSSPDAALRFNAETPLPAASSSLSSTPLVEIAGAGKLERGPETYGRTVDAANAVPQLAQTAAVALLVRLQIKHLLA